MEQIWHLERGTLLKDGKYRLICSLGNDEFGITYEAEDIPQARTVAIREFFIGKLCDRDGNRMTVRDANRQTLVDWFLERFFKEAQTVKTFDHRRIVRITDCFRENETAYYVMNELPGGSLSELVEKEGPLSEGQAEMYIRQVAEGLAYLHSRNMVHLDVRPSGILINKMGKAVLCDFGGSKHWSAGSLPQQVIPEGGKKIADLMPAVHNEGFAPLELKREEKFGPSTDIYSLGATLYYLVTGTIPPAASALTVFGWERPEGVSSWIWNLIETAMRPLAADRPQTIDAFLSLLDTATAEAEEETPFQNVFEVEETVPSFHEEEFVQEQVQEPLEEVVQEPVPEPEPEPEPVPEPEPEPVPEPVIPPAVPPKKKKPGKTGLWVALGVVAVVAALMALLFGGKPKAGNERNVEKERANYERMVVTCRDSIRAWSDSRGTVPSEALTLLSNIRKDELQYGRYAGGFDASPELGMRLVEKMETAMKKWEAAGDAQKRVNPSMARECYNLSLQLARSIESVEQEIFGLDPADVQKKGRSKKIQSKMD